MIDRPTSIYPLPLADWETWAHTPLQFGDRYCSDPTELDDLLQVILVLETVERYPSYAAEVSWNYKNVAEIVRARIVLDYHAAPLVRPDDEYCTVYRGWDAKDWMRVFDLVLHDTAVTAVGRGDKHLANFLWGMSRQLRQIQEGEEARARAIREAKDGYLLTPGEHLRAAYRSARWHASLWERRVRSDLRYGRTLKRAIIGR